MNDVNRRAGSRDSLAGDLLIIVGFLFVTWVSKENSFTSGVIEVAAE